MADARIYGSDIMGSVVSILMYKRRTEDGKYTSKHLDDRMRAMVHAYNGDYETDDDIADFIRDSVTDLVTLYDDCRGYYEWRTIIMDMIKHEVAERSCKYAIYLLGSNLFSDYYRSDYLLRRIGQSADNLQQIFRLILAH